MNYGSVRILTVFSLLITLLAAPMRIYPAQTNAEIDSLLQKITKMYEEGSFLAAEIEGRRLIEEGKLSDTTRIQVEKYIAFSLIAQDKPQSAIPHFRTILQIDSSFDLDPQLTSPKILSIFQQTREKYFIEHRSPPQHEPLLTISQQPTYRTILFPGWEQLHQGRQGIGYTFLSVGAVSLLSTVYCDFQRRSSRDSYLQAPTTELAIDRYTKYNAYYKTEIYSAALFALTYIVSEVEVFTRRADEATTQMSNPPGNTYTVVSLKIPF